MTRGSYSLFLGKGSPEKDLVLKKSKETCLGLPIITSMKEISPFEVRHHQCGNLLRDIYSKLKGTNPDKVIVIRKMQQLGFKSPETFGRVVQECYLLPGKVRSKSCGDGLQPSAVAFVVLDTPLPSKVLQALEAPTELDIGQIPVLLQRYIPRAEPRKTTDGITPVLASVSGSTNWDSTDSSSRPSSGSDLTIEDFDVLDDILTSLIGSSLAFLRARQH